MTTGRAALVVLLHRYLGGLMDPFVTLLEVHKLMYFMQEAGEPLRLHYAKAPYGPYADNLRHVLRRSRAISCRAIPTAATRPRSSLSSCPAR